MYRYTQAELMASRLHTCNVSNLAVSQIFPSGRCSLTYWSHIQSNKCRVVQKLEGVVGRYFWINRSLSPGGCPGIYILFTSLIIAKLHDISPLPARLTFSRASKWTSQIHDNQYDKPLERLVLGAFRQFSNLLMAPDLRAEQHDATRRRDILMFSVRDIKKHAVVEAKPF